MRLVWLKLSDETRQLWNLRSMSGDKGQSLVTIC